MHDVLRVLRFGAAILAVSWMGCAGKDGPAGPAGPAGAAGPAGDAGPQGAAGAAGDAGTANVFYSGWLSASALKTVTVDGSNVVAGDIAAPVPFLIAPETGSMQYALPDGQTIDLRDYEQVREAFGIPD